MRGGFALALRALALSSLVVLAGGDVTYTRLTDGVDTPPHVTAMDEAMYFDFDLPPRTDAVLTLDVLDGDADLYVLGPTIPATTGVLPSPSYRTWYSIHSASTDDIVYISSREASAGNGTGGIFRVGVWGWSSAGAGGAAGSEWTLRVDLVPGGRNNTAAQATAMTGVYDACCGDDGSCAAWNLAGGRTADACHVRGMLCDASGDVRHLRLVNERLRCHLDGAVLAALASVFATAERVELGNNPNLRVTSGSGNGAALLEALYLAAPSLTHLHVSGSPVFDDGDDDGATFSQSACAATPSGLVSLRLSNSGLRGPVPDGCVVTATLRDAQLDDNRLNGTLPAVPHGSALSVFTASYRARLGFGVLLIGVVFLIRAVGDGGALPPWVWLVGAVPFCAHTVSNSVMFVAQMAFFNRVSDPKIGGTYMTMLNTISNLGGQWPGPAILSAKAALEAYPTVDAFAVVAVGGVALSLAWLAAFSGRAAALQSMAIKQWHA